MTGPGQNSGGTGQPGVQPLHCLGVGGVAEWFSVEPKTVTQWMIRHSGYPAPDVIISPGQNGRPHQGWLPEREAEWRAWRATFPGQGAGGGRGRRKHSPQNSTAAAPANNSGS